MDLLLALCTFVFTTAVSPGPNNILLMSSGVNFGFRRSLPLISGICIGFPSMVLAVGLGLSEVFQRFPLMHTSIKTLGICYLLYMAYRLVMSRSEIETRNRPEPLGFFQAAAFQWVNPKAWVMAIGAMGAFTSLNDPLTPQVLKISSVFFFIGVPTALLWLGLGLSLKRFLNAPHRQRRFNLLMASLLVLSIVPIILPE
ncbi:LysE family translocator [Shewanella corallii]|uniref:LysE family translocator n=1 Tax=Shewanella corallii TaxID=560080 RepID=A0ABT0N4B0_9GAMM|nr:LysE family translocator [Shewanella corallii]MCL2913247.1 LysE family translocator [Shewanella corallii]